MSQWYVYKTKKGTIFTVGLSGDIDTTIKVTALDHNIPPSPAKLVGIFEANSMYDYIHNMTLVLLDNLKKDTELVAICKILKKRKYNEN